MSTNAIPLFPVELLENIISEAWSSPLTADERITLMTASLLVNKTWSAVFTRVSSKDVHIPCESYAEQLFRVLREESPIYDEQTRSLPDRLCHSLTFKIHADPLKGSTPIQLFGLNHRMAETMGNTLYAIHTIGYFPNLRRVCIEYVDWGYEDIIDHYRLIAFPEQVTEFELKFSFSKNIPQSTVDTLRANYVRHDCLPWHMSSIRCLTILGAGADFVTDIAKTCNNSKMLITDVYFDHFPPESR
jgi:hypothetical protein